MFIFFKITNLFIIFIILFLINLVVIYNDGFRSRFDFIKKYFFNYEIDSKNSYLLKKQFIKSNSKNYFTEDKDKIKVLFIGDSYAEDLQNVFLLSKDKYNKYDFSLLLNNNFDLKKIFLEKTFAIADIIILSYRWKNINEAAIIEQNSFSSLQKKIKNKKVILVYRTEFKTYEYLTKTLIDREIQKKSNDLKNIDIFSYKSIYFKNRTFKNEDDLSLRLKEISKNNNFTFWDFGETQCNYKELECDYITADGFKIYYDYGHFTLEGSKYFGEKIENYIIKEFKILN